jgi:hypothetical protein
MKKTALKITAAALCLGLMFAFSGCAATEPVLPEETYYKVEISTEYFTTDAAKVAALSEPFLGLTASRTALIPAPGSNLTVDEGITLTFYYRSGSCGVLAKDKSNSFIVQKYTYETGALVGNPTSHTGYRIQKSNYVCALGDSSLFDFVKNYNKAV